MNKILEVNNLTFAYEDRAILNDFSCTMNEGDFVGIIGRNGAGKTTLLNLILGNLKKYKGEIKLFGDDIKGNNHLDDISYISQSAVSAYKNFPTTISECLKINLRRLKKNIDADQMFKDLDLYDHRNKRLSELSGGQLQKLGILLALIKDSDFIILDEPTNNIDPAFTYELLEILTKLKSEGKTILMVTHNMEITNKYLDYVFKVEKGRCEVIDARNV